MALEATTFHNNLADTMYRQSLYSHIINKTHTQKENRLCGNAHFKRHLQQQKMQ